MTCIEGGPYELFELAEAQGRQRLASSPLGRLLPGEVVVDLFCGAGGWGEGAKTLGLEVNYAVNHWDTAISTHAINNPACSHHRGDAWKARPRGVIGRRTKLGVLFASAACTTHSRARGSAPVSKRVHMLGWCIARWMREAAPRIVLIENVPEWQDWGPTFVDAEGVRRQDKARKGQLFRRWWRYCQRLGYVMEMRVLDAPDYGEASRRRRLFIVARRDGQPITWPEVTHGERSFVGAGEAGRDTCSNSRQRDGRRGAGVCVRPGSETPGVGRRPLPYRTAAEVIDFSDLGRSIFGRKTPLKPKTQGRIAEGLRRHLFNEPNPFVLRVTHSGDGSGWRVSPIDAPLPTQTTRQDLGVATPVLATTRNGERDGQAARVHPVASQLMTVTGGAVQGLASPILAGAGGCTFAPARPDAPYHAVLPREDTGLVTPILAPQNTGVFGQRVDRPGPTLTQTGHQSLIAPVLHAIRGDVKGRDVRGQLPTITAGNGPGRGAGAPHAQCLASPVLMNNTTHHTGGRVDGPTPTVTTGGQAGLVAPVMVAPVRNSMRHGGGQTGRADSPVPALCAGGNHEGVVAPLLAEYYGNSTTLRPADAPLGAVTTLDRHAGVNVLLGDGGLARAREVAAWLVKHLGDAVPIDPENGLAYVVIGGERRYFADILFRMLRVLELAAAMGFPPEYQWPRTRKGTINQRASTRLIGNAVSVRTAAAIVGAVLPGLKVKAKRKAVRG